MAYIKNQYFSRMTCAVGSRNTLERRLGIKWNSGRSARKNNEPTGMEERFVKRKMAGSELS